MTHLRRLLFETSPFSPFWAAWFAGFCIVDQNGVIRLTAAGDEYLRGVEG